MSQVEQRTTRQKRKIAVRSKLHGTAKRPRLSVFRSNQHIQLQVINDETGKTLLGMSDMGHDQPKGTKTERAVKLAQQLAKKLKAKKIQAIVFDRSPYRYHGRIKAVAEALREAGIEF
jgi:large subunit ribosomal protein L18